MSQKKSYNCSNNKANRFSELEIPANVLRFTGGPFSIYNMKYVCPRNRVIIFEK